MDAALNNLRKTMSMRMRRDVPTIVDVAESEEEEEDAEEAVVSFSLDEDDRIADVRFNDSLEGISSRFAPILDHDCSLEMEFMNGVDGAGGGCTMVEDRGGIRTNLDDDVEKAITPLLLMMIVMYMQMNMA